MQTENTDDLFVIPGVPVNDTTPYNEFDCFYWAEQQPRGRRLLVIDYLEARGFVTGKHRIEEQEYDIIKNVLNYCAQHLPRMRGTWRFDELFTPAMPHEPGFAVQGADTVTGRAGRYTPTQELRKALVEAGWIYNVHPTTTYFVIINGYVLAKYQTIIGNRRMAKLAD